MPSVQIIGESCLDIFIYCDAPRLAPDLPIPILREVFQKSNPGMAANVERNFLNKGVKSKLLTNQNWHEITKTRYVHEKTNHTFFRVDSSREIVNFDIQKFRPEADVIVISDYDKGFLSESMISQICQSHEFVFLDTKKELGEWARDAFIIKINDYEYSRSISRINDDLRSKLIVTRGAEGCNYRGVDYPVEKVEVRDTSGAGDSFLAALVVAFLETRDLEKSILYANESASRVVRSRGVGTI